MKKKTDRPGRLFAFVLTVVALVLCFSMQLRAADIYYGQNELIATVQDGVICQVTMHSDTSEVVVIDEAATPIPYEFNPSSHNLTIQASNVKGQIHIYANQRFSAVKSGEQITLPEGDVTQPSDGQSEDVISVIGSYVVYETLTAVVPANAGEVTYQWYRDSGRISGATGATYTLTKADIGKSIYVNVTGQSYGTKVSNAKVVEKLESALPTADDVKIVHVSKNGASTGSITSATTSGRTIEYYDIKYNAWKTLPCRSCTAGEYQIRFAATTDTKESAFILVRVLEPAPAPTSADVVLTNNTAAGGKQGSIVPVAGGKAMEYSSGGVWYSLPAYGLTAGEYSVRFAASAGNLASDAAVFYIREPSALQLTETDLAITHNTTNGGSTGAIRSSASAKGILEANINGSWKKLPVSGLKAGTYQVRYAETNTTFAGRAMDVIVKEPAVAPSGYTIKDVTTFGGKDGSVFGLSTAWQFSTDQKNWTDCTSTTLKELAAGKIYLRTKATAYLTESAVVTLMVRQPDKTPEAIIDYVNASLKNLIANKEYLIGNTVYTASASGTIVLPDAVYGTEIALIKKGDETTTLNSAAQKIKIDKRPDKPPVPVIIAKTDKTISVRAENGKEYSLDGKNWYSATEIQLFSGLLANSEYTVYTRLKAVEGVSFVSPNTVLTVKTKKSSSQAVVPTAPVISEITDTTITIRVVAGQEYHIGGDWVKPSDTTYTWRNLSEKTSYTIYTRTCETDDTMYSATVYTRTSTYAKLKLAAFTIDYLKGGLVGLNAGNYCVNGNNQITLDADGILHLEVFFGRTITLVQKGSPENKTVDSDPVSITLNSPTTAPAASLLNKESIRCGLNAITVAATNTRIEYYILNDKKEPLSAGIKGTGTAVTFDGLKDDTDYYIQLSFSATASAPQSNGYIVGPIHTLRYESTPGAAVDTVARVLTGLDSISSYLINGSLYQTAASGTVYVEESWIGTVISVIKLGNGTTTADSLPQELALPDFYALSLTGVNIVPVTYYGAKNGAIYGLRNDLEYSADNGKQWLPVTGTYLEQLQAGDYLIRKKAAAGIAFASLPKTFTVPTDIAVADAIQALSNALAQEYQNRKDSGRYNDKQLAEIRNIIDVGMKEVYDTLNAVSEVTGAGEKLLTKIGQVRCTNTATPDGKLTGSEITDNDTLQYPNDSDEIWGNLRADSGLSSGITFHIDKLGQTATQELRALVNEAIAQKKILPYGEITSAQLQESIRNVEIKMGLSITMRNGDDPVTEFNGPYIVTMLLPLELQGADRLNIVALDSQNNVELHAARVIGKYLVFETDHFSTYGILALDEVSQARSDALAFINDHFNQLNPKDYSHDNWGKIQQIVDMSASRVQLSSSKNDIEQAKQDYVTAVEAINQKVNLTWLWILLVVLAVLLGLFIACLLVWRVRYYDGKKNIKSEFYLCHTAVHLMICSKDKYILEGWYYDMECTKRAEDGFLMPWNGVKLYAKWKPLDDGDLLLESESTPLLPPVNMSSDGQIQEQTIETASDIMLETSDQTDGEQPKEPVENTDAIKEDASNDPRKSSMYLRWLELGSEEFDEEENADGDAEEGDGEVDEEDELFTNEKTGERYHVRFNVSYIARLTSLSDDAKDYYTQLKNELLSYKGIKTRISWKNESFRRGRLTVARFNVRDNILCVYLALDPDEYQDTKFVYESVKDIKAYENVPMLVYVKNELACKKVKDLFADMMGKLSVVKQETDPDAEMPVYDYLKEDSSTAARLRAGQLKIRAEGPDADVCAARAAAATVHYLFSPEISAEDADKNLTDDLLIALIHPLGRPNAEEAKIEVITLDKICKKFYQGDEVTPETLAAAGLLAPGKTYIRIVGNGVIDKKLNVRAHAFDKVAAKMILLAGGEVTVL